MKTPLIIVCFIIIGCSASNIKESHIDFERKDCVRINEEINLKYNGGCDSLSIYFHKLFDLGYPSYFTEWIEPFIISAEGEFSEGKIQTARILTSTSPEVDRIIEDGLLSIKDWEVCQDQNDIKLFYRFYLKKGAIMKPVFIFEKMNKNNSSDNMRSCDNALCHGFCKPLFR